MWLWRLNGRCLYLPLPYHSSTLFHTPLTTARTRSSEAVGGCGEWWARHRDPCCGCQRQGYTKSHRRVKGWKISLFYFIFLFYHRLTASNSYPDPFHSIANIWVVGAFGGETGEDIGEELVGERMMKTENTSHNTIHSPVSPLSSFLSLFLAHSQRLAGRGN